MSVENEVETCPNCEASLQGLPIPQEYIDAGHYGDKTHYSRMIGVEVPGVYDGILYWMCPDCGWAWQRWPEGSVKASAAGDRIAENNEDVAKGKK